MTQDPLSRLKSLDEAYKLIGSMASTELAASAGTLTKAGVTNILQLCDALWLHSGDPRDPHAELTAGDCSDGFVDVLRALRYTVVSDILAYHMSRRIEDKMDELDLWSDAVGVPSIGWVIGSDHAGATFSHDVARWLSAMHDFTEKGGSDNKEQLWRRFAIGENEPVLQVEELMTTSTTLLRVREGIRKGNPGPVNFLPFVATLVHRSEIYEIEGGPVIYLAHYDIKKWKPEECPLCAQGSKRLKPKTHWAELTRKA
ncbi:MAG: hypothetical protein KGZ30_01655 [Anaplasmataceae bacterium]|nr:hypothetical protein [Anaplasmataceae bacterium]